MLHRMNQANADKRKARKASITVIRSPGASTVFVVSIFSNFRFDFYSFSSGNKLQGITRTEGIQITVLWIFFTVERLLVRNESHSDLF